MTDRDRERQTERQRKSDSERERESEEKKCYAHIMLQNAQDAAWNKSSHPKLVHVYLLSHRTSRIPPKNGLNRCSTGVRKVQEETSERSEKVPGRYINGILKVSRVT